MYGVPYIVLGDVHWARLEASALGSVKAAYAACRSLRCLSYAACPTGKERKRKEGGNGRDLSGILKRKRWQPTLAPGPTSVVNTMSLTINKQTIHYRQQ